MRNLKILVTVVDNTQKPLDDIQKRVHKTGETAKKASINFTQFNRTLFTTAAFAGTFIKGFNSLTRSLEEGANLDRITGQFERVMGPKGALFQAIDSMTDASIDKMEALKAGISLGNLGIIKDTKTLASVVINAGVAAKLAGKDSAEGIQQYTEFLKTGNISSLQFLDLISQTNPALQAQMAILGKAGGVMGQVVTTQARLALGQSLLRAAVKGQLKGFRDLKDSIFDVKQAWGFLRGEIGQLLGKALAPLIDSLTAFIWKAQSFVEDVRKNHKEIVFLTKAFVVATGAVIGLAGAFGTLRLATIALGSIGFGLPKLIALTVGLGSTFIGITKPATTLVDKLKLLGAVFKGIYELVTNLNSETGLSKMSKSTYLLLKQNGLLGFVQFMGRAISVVKRVVGDMYDAFKWLAKKVDDIFGGFATKIISFFEKINEPWSNFWVSESLDPIKKFLRGASVLLTGFFAWVAGKKAFGMLSGMLSKIPGLGKFFGGGGDKGSGPAGTAGDPFYVVMADKALELLRKIPGVGGLGGAISGRLGKITAYLSSKFQDLILRSKILGEIFTHPAGKLKGLMSVLGGFTRTFVTVGKSLLTGISGLAGTLLRTIVSMFAGLGPILGPAIAVGAAALIGYGIGTAINSLLEKYTQGKTEEGFEGDAVERAFFKLSKWTGIGPAQEFIDNQEKMRRNEEAALKRVNEVRKRQGKPPVSSLEEIGAPTEAAPTVPRLFTPMNQPGQTTATATPLPADHELEMLNELGESLQATPNSSALTMQQQYERMLNEGKKPSEIVAEKLGTKLDDTNYFLEGILKNTSPNRSLQSNPMSKREK
jgi:hypothetical protein